MSVSDRARTIIAIILFLIAGTLVLQALGVVKDSPAAGSECEQMWQQFKSTPRAMAQGHTLYVQECEASNQYVRDHFGP